MNPNTRITIAPLLALVGALFVGTVLAPRAWRDGGVGKSFEKVASDRAVPLPLRFRRFSAAGAWTGGVAVRTPVFGIRPADRRRGVGSPRGLSEIEPGTSGLGAIVPGELWRRDLDPAAAADLLLPGVEAGSLGKRETATAWPVATERIDTPAGARFRATSPSLVQVAFATGRPVRSLEPQPWNVSAPVGTLPRNASHVDVPHRSWPLPVALLNQLEAAGGIEGAERWSTRTRDALQRLANLPLWGDAEVDAVLAELEGLGEEAARISEAVVEPSQRRELRRIHFAIARRLDVWGSVRAAVSQDGLTASAADADASSLAHSLARVGQRVRDLPQAAAWRDYLLLDELGRVAEGTANGPGHDHRQLAVRLLGRLDHDGLTTRQRQFLSSPEFDALAGRLRGWVTEPVAYVDLLERLEHFEQQQDPLAGGQFGRVIAGLRVTGSPAVAELAWQLERSYRNANVRVVLADEFVGRLFPKEITGNERIRDLIGGARVAGRGRAHTRLDVELLPDASRWRVAVSARGELVSDTRSRVGPATFFNHARSDYQLRHIVTLGDSGLSIEPAGGTAQTSTRLTGLETRLDFVPLVGGLVQSIAQRRYEQRLPLTRRELRRRVASNASSRLEQEMQSRTREASDRVREHVLQPLRDLDLTPVPIELRTTDRQLIARYRLSGSRQLGSHTPRPREPQDSLFAFQLHQSLLNNGLEKLDLAGRRKDLPTLFREIAAALGRENAEVPDDLQREDAVIHFAQRQPIRVDFEDQRIHVTLRLAELDAGGQRSWRRLVVRASYQLLEGGQFPRIERDGYIQLQGARLRLRDQIALRGIFSKMFPRHPALNDMAEPWRSEPLLSGIENSQFVARDGWLGLAWSSVPEVAARPPAAREQAVRGAKQ